MSVIEQLLITVLLFDDSIRQAATKDGE